MKRSGKSLVNDPELRAQVRDYAGALRELGPGWEDAVAEALVEKRFREHRRKPSLAWFTVTLAFGIPLTATAGTIVGLPGAHQLAGGQSLDLGLPRPG